MRFIATTIAFASITTAFTPANSYDSISSGKNASTSVSSSKGSNSTISLKSTPLPPKACAANIVTVYETAYGAKVNPTATRAASGSAANPTVIRSASDSKGSPLSKVAKPFGYSEEQFRPKTEGDVTLKACNHWSHDAKDPKNLIPTSVGDKTQLYYAENGKPQPSKTFYFGVIDLFFKAPAVVLEQSAYITKAAYSNNQLVIDFSSVVACDFAKTTWTKGTIIVSSSAGCKKSSDDDQCYFEVEDLTKSDDGKTIIVKGKPQSQNDCTEGGEASWGMYRPSVSNGGTIVNQPGKNGTVSFNGTAGFNGTTSFNGTTGSNGGSGSSGTWPGSNNTNAGSGFGSTNATGDGSKFGDEQPTCRAPVDTKYNLPTACVGEYFDLDLDETLGYGELSADDLAFLKEATAGLDDDVLAKVTRRAVLHHQNVRRLSWNPLKAVVNFVEKKIYTPIKTLVVNHPIVQLVTTGAISGSIRESFSFALPQPNGANADAKQVESPWGAAILIAAYGTDAKAQSPNGVQRDGYLNIYCVGCGAQGRVELAGAATWSVTQGITKGELEVWADIKAALKIGVDAQIQLNKEWNKNLFQIGLPGLSFGVITIGPQVKLDSRVTLEASAKGRLLAGAELSWNRAYAKVDMVNPANSKKENFDPVFTPVFEAEGEIFVGAELGLPIGLHFGISITSWKKTVALINEPMIKGIAKAAAKAELANGAFSAGFTATEGCIGIHTNLSWRNRLYGDVLGVRQYDIMDTGYKSIKSVCIAIGPQKQTPAVGDGAATGPKDPAQGDGEQATPQTPADGADQSATPQTPADGVATDGAPQTPKDGNATPGTSQTPADNGVEVAAPQAPAAEVAHSDTPSTPANDNAPARSDSAAGGVSDVETRSILSRQLNSTSTTSTTNSTVPAGLRDLTDSVKKASDIITYPMADIPTSAYTREDGYEFTKILAGAYNLFYCSNGNTYVKQTSQSAGLGCDELFVQSDNAVVGDGAGRYLYYHTNTMQAAGVSRLRLGDEEQVVVGTSALALVPWNAAALGEEADADMEGLYFAADFDTKAVYWLTFCSYKDGQPPKVFLVQDVEKGIAVLESGDVKFSITGGDVDTCYALSAKEDGASQSSWAEFDDSESTTPDGLEFELE